MGKRAKPDEIGLPFIGQEIPKAIQRAEKQVSKTLSKVDFQTVGLLNTHSSV